MFLLAAIAGFILGFVARQIIGRHQISFYKHKMSKLTEFIEKMKYVNDKLVEEVKHHRKVARSKAVDEMQAGVIEAMASFVSEEGA